MNRPLFKLWLRVCPALVCMVATAGAGPDKENLVFYLSCDDAVNPVDESADPATVMLHGSLTSVPGQFGTQALGFNGNKANRIQVLNNPKLDGMSGLTVEAWIQTRNLASHAGMPVVSKRVSNSVADSYSLFIWYAQYGPYLNARVNTHGFVNWDVVGKTAIQDNTWYHAAFVFDGQAPADERMKVYLNGVLDGTLSHPDTRVVRGNASLWIGDEGESEIGYTWDGALDEIGIWNAALTEAQIRQVMLGSKLRLVKAEIAGHPSPADGSGDVPLTADLAWTPGKYAATHNVYFSPSWADVNAADPTVLAAEGLARDDSRLRVGPLDYGRTYYWRVDEANAAPDATVYEGAVWSFTAEPYAYPLTSVTATASSRQRGMTPDRTVDGSGLDQSEAHSTEPTDMWLSRDAVPQWIVFAFDKVYTLHEMRIWNSNQLLEPILGFGAKSVTIETSTDGAAWTALEGVPEFARAPGLPAYTANTVVDFAGVRAQYVRLTINTNWGGVAPQTGLAEVQFSYIPLQARGPEPATATTDVSLDATLNWRPGREATSHEVFFGTDRSAVADGTIAAQTVAEPSYVPASLDFGTMYYWKVNEIGVAGVSGGDLWSFATQEYATIDDFESYTDQPGEEVFSAWIDGFTNGLSGSTVGDSTASGAPAGTMIFHGGSRSMPLQYDNTAGPFFSEAERTFAAAQDWTSNGADSLVVYFRGLAPGFVETASGSILMNGIGADIWDTGDQFRYAYKTLSGDGSMVARVDSVFASSAWAKAGVMIRQSIQPGSVHAFMPITPGGGNGASFQRRLTTGGPSTSSGNTGAVVAAPYWAKIERKGNDLSGYISPDGVTWTQLGTAQTIPMTNPVLIGLALTSHEAAVATGAEFSNVSTTGNVTGAWQVAQIGATQPEGNSLEGLYLSVQDATGKTKVVQHPDPGATAYIRWQTWTIPLSDFTSAGVNMTAVKSLTLGVGNKAGPKAGGTGTVYIDDLGYGTPAK